MLGERNNSQPTKRASNLNKGAEKEKRKKSNSSKKLKLFFKIKN